MMCDKCSIRDCPPRSAIELLKEAEARKKYRADRKEMEFIEDYMR